MFCLNDTMRYYLCPGRTDMRKGISSLCGRTAMLRATFKL